MEDSINWTLEERFLLTIEEFNCSDDPEQNFKDFIQTIAEGSADGMKLNSDGIILIRRGRGLIQWDVLKGIYKLNSDYQKYGIVYKINTPYIDPEFFKGLIL